MLRHACGYYGLSPRARGNPSPNTRNIPRGRSIPACAGEPTTVNAATMAAKVYPRVRGGTTVRQLLLARFAGLSPRARGNRNNGRPAARVRRSIPACAGEPAELFPCAHME